MYPKELNFKMPAEWGMHQRTLISWPVKASMCYPDNYENVCSGYKEFVNAISEFEPVTILVNEAEEKAVKTLFDKTNIRCLIVNHNDAWLRDNGPTFLTDGRGNLAGINWQFNAWGEKYAPWDLDNAAAAQILSHFHVQQFDAPLVMEGGSFHTDGEGTLITTKECLLNPNRNPNLSVEQIEDYLRNYLHVEKIIWLNRGLSGDETDGHVDNIACFAAPGKIVIQICEDPEDENYKITHENLEILRNTVDARGRKLEIIPVIQPPRTDYKGSRLTLSYLNFYFVNKGIILPIFGGSAKETDQKAEAVMKTVFPDRKIRTINGMAVISEGGNIHCMTQQMPQP